MALTPEKLDAHLARCAAQFGCDMAEARRRYETLAAHVDDPADPICTGCAKRPADIPEYIEAATAYYSEPGDPSVLPDKMITPAEYVMREEGTYNRANGHFACTDCYITIGCPSGPPGRRWTAP